ncbi:MAG: hypothetical protein LBQ59_01265 [Candidatus Peribacteria bacterium]|jgi:hypothetical protein|nr:hypothetical protein [Candidatus Peribacteria bacterium]
MATNLEIKFFSIEEDAELKKRPAIEYEQIMKDAKEFVEQAEIDDKLDELETRLKSENADITKRIEAKLALLGEFKAKKQQEE